MIYLPKQNQQKKTMKKTILLLIMLTMGIMVSAQKPVVEHIDNYTTHGLRAFFDAGKSMGGDFSSTLFSGVYGKQIDAQNFLGGGLMLSWGGDRVNFGILGDYRYEIFDSKMAPFLDGRVGINFSGDGASLMVNPTVGYRYGHISLAMGLESGIGNYGYNVFQIRLGLDFGGRVR